ncbi:hypothetical protein JHK85_025425 [Glycine max]|nr:hypothetical protein JHK85_025425 [Glycine max]
MEGYLASPESVISTPSEILTSTTTQQSLSNPRSTLGESCQTQDERVPGRISKGSLNPKFTHGKSRQTQDECIPGQISKGS